MHKLDKYLKKICPEYIESAKSRYYKFNSHVLRVSDHIGSNSSGHFSIIILSDHYLMHNHLNGSVIVLSYQQVLTFVKGVQLCSSLITGGNILNFAIDTHDNKHPIENDLEFKRRIFIAWKKLGRNSQNKFRVAFGLKGKSMSNLSSWSTKRIQIDDVQNFFKARGVAL